MKIRRVKLCEAQNFKRKGIYPTLFPQIAGKWETLEASVLKYTPDYYFTRKSSTDLVLGDVISFAVTTLYPGGLSRAHGASSSGAQSVDADGC